VRAANFTGALAVAALLAFSFIVPRVAHIDTWKIVLALGGFALFVSAGLDSRRHT